MVNKLEDEKDSQTDREMKSTLFLVNIVLTTKVKKLQEEVEELKEKLRKYEMHGPPGNMKYGSDMEKRKRKRKTKDQVERNFCCNIGQCGKSYGSENSLNQHMKLKHPDFWNKIKEKEQSLTKSVANSSRVSNSLGEKKNENTNKNLPVKRNYEQFSAINKIEMPIQPTVNNIKKNGNLNIKSEDPINLENS